MRQIYLFALLVFFLIISSDVQAQGQTELGLTNNKKTKEWYEKIQLRGYAQIRYNRLLETNGQLKCEQCDRSWGENGGFFLRRMRLIFSGQISKRVFIYIQPDFASNASSSSLHFGQLRDAYFDLGFDDKNEFRLRIGQSKIPFGFENMQSSQNRLPLDRNDGINSAIPNERDMGAFFYWAPESKRKLFTSLVRDGLKGSGDYGIFAFGLYNGQTANRPEQNNEPHVVSRITWPFEMGSQIIEGSLQAYTGKYVVTTDQINSSTKVTKDRSYIDRRVAATFVLYPKPFGILAEYNIGEGPEFNKNTDSIEVQSLSGGFITLTYMFKYKNQVIMPFTRLHHYNGGKKFETDARSYNVDELELGVEWQPTPSFELVTMYTFSKRRFEDFRLQDNLQQGSLLRLQAQINF